MVTAKELKSLNPETYENILKTYSVFYDTDTGFYALRHQILELVKEKLAKQYNNNTDKFCERYNMLPEDAKRKQEELIYYGVFSVIDELENNGTLDKNNQTLTDAEDVALKSAIVEKTKYIFNEISAFLNHTPNGTVQDMEKVISEKANLADQTMRFAFTPEQIQKYHFGFGCNHVTIGFIKMYQALSQKSDIKLMLTTRWDHLHNGRDGHVVPCIKMKDSDGKELYYAFEPQLMPKKGKIPFVVPGYSENAQGQTIFHLLRYGAGAPYMITTNLISPDEYMNYLGNHTDFIQKYSKVKHGEAFAFLDQQVSLGNLTRDEVENFKKKYNEYHAEKLKAANNQVKGMGAQTITPTPSRVK